MNQESLAGTPPGPLDSAVLCDTLLAAVNDAVVVCNAHGKVVTANPAATRMAGAGPSASTWRRMPLPAGWEITDPDGAAAEAEAFPTTAVLADARPRRGVRVHALRPNGKRVAFDVTALPLVDPASGRLAGAATTFADVTRRLQLEAEAQEQRSGLDTLAAEHARALAQAHEMLERSARFCHAITDAIPAQVAYWERGAICRFANREFMQWIGKPSDSPLGHSRLDLYGAEHAAAVQARVQSALGGHVERFALPLRAADGRSATFRMLFVPARGADGTVHGLYSIAYDVETCQARR